ncbi:hypothetical protein Patl1_22973 [Pistacia atlantica]|uniref:Uncharacterized protein n=1 Tax=Pistacia atlantica TaxID=434234 RepID=A0ACC0ZXS9_9ROSI|nr:hypothetical protein Patl1_22973 [Pistacia atlantica]
MGIIDALISGSALLSELVAKGVLTRATQEFGGKLASASSVPEVQLSRYVPALEKLVILRLVQQVSQVYQMMKIESLSQMIPFIDFKVVEKISVDAVKHNFIAMKFDHMSGVVSYGNLKRLAAEYEQRKNQRILREIEECELEEAQAPLEEAEKRSKKKGGKKPILEGEKVTEQTLMERALIEQLRERQEVETNCFQRRSVEEKVLHERDQQRTCSLDPFLFHPTPTVCEAGVRLATETKFALCSFSGKIPGRVLNRCKAEFDRRRVEREERINQIIQARKQEREVMRKKIYYARCEDERMKKLREEEGARKWEEAERRRKEEAERKAKLDEIAENQRQRERELEDKERLRREALLGRPADVPAKPFELPARASEPGTAAPAAAAPSAGKYVPRFVRERTEGSGQSPPTQPDWCGVRPQPESDRWGRRTEGSAPVSESDRWGSNGNGRPDDHAAPASDRWL